MQTIPFDETIAPARSYLNDVRVDTKSGHAFITESGVGAIVVVDLAKLAGSWLIILPPKLNLERRLSSTDENYRPEDRQSTGIHADGIAFDKEGGWLYYHPLTGETLYRINTEHLLDEALSSTQLGAKVEKLATTQSRMACSRPGWFGLSHRI